jgi:endonuclease YncB( thermonuclease family)
MIKEGLAVRYEKKGTKYDEEYKTAQETAKENEAGVWGKCEKFKIVDKTST